MAFPRKTPSSRREIRPMDCVCNSRPPIRSFWHSFSSNQNLHSRVISFNPGRTDQPTSLRYRERWICSSRIARAGSLHICASPITRPLKVERSAPSASPAAQIIPPPIKLAARTVKCRRNPVLVRARSALADNAASPKARRCSGFRSEGLPITEAPRRACNGSIIKIAKLPNDFAALTMLAVRFSPPIASAVLAAANAMKPPVQPYCQIRAVPR